jgi:hypothetical protein
MGISRGNITTNIIKSGLVFNMDAANRASYPKSGTIWNDTISNITGSLINGTSFDSSINQGSMVFDGIEDDIQTGPTLGLDGNVGTVSTFLKTGFSNSDSGVYYLWDFRDASLTTNLTIYYYNAQGGFAYHIGSGQGNIAAVSHTFSSGTNLMITATYDFNSDNYAFYINGVSKSTSTSAYSTPGTINKVTIAGRYNQDASSFYPGSIGNFQIYNRALSAKEVLHNYNALKGRFI